MADKFSTDVLAGVIANLKQPVSWLLDRYFGTLVQDDAEEIHFDVIPGKRRIAPFVSPLVEGKVVDQNGRRVDTFRPAYIKDKRIFDSSRPFKRAVGEQIGGPNLTPAQREDVHLASELQDALGMITRRLEVMASEALRTAKVTVAGEKYPTTVVDFARNGANTITALSGTARWGQSAAAPLDNFQDWGMVGLQNGGAYPADVIMGVTAWKNFRKDPTVKDRLLAINTFGQSMAQDAAQIEGGRYMGTLDGHNIYVYAGWYVDPDTGSETEIWPAKAVAMVSAAVEGARLFGAIKDPKANYGAMPFFPKSWEQDDPSVRYVMVQSAPLVAPLRPDVTVYNSDVVG